MYLNVEVVGGYTTAFATWNRWTDEDTEKFARYAQDVYGPGCPLMEFGSAMACVIAALMGKSVVQCTGKFPRNDGPTIRIKPTESCV